MTHISLYGHKTFEYQFYAHPQKMTNQNTVSNIYSVLVGRFWSTNVELQFILPKVLEILCIFFI